ncbi:hypothetical protein UFOVP1016_15 [uncultured Caudovirales phage]|uniref:Uncharacterized protein n=1 Tax=uncultured Caudovirales phage TaxID=2100421 RepID=A0A6J5Q5X9_9CAUD|nr:hypothetical protein UFOVP1016_15 [uncultured Caudovirales phage]
MNHEAIRKLNPSIVTIRGDVAYDADENEVTYDKSAVDAYVNAHAYIAKRSAEYPPITDYLDGVVKNDQAQIDAYIAACQAVKSKYPKGA